MGSVQDKLQYEQMLKDSGMAGNVSSAKETGDSPWFATSIVRPDNYRLLIQSRKAFGKDDNYEQVMKQYKADLEKAQQEYQRKNPNSGWFGF